MCDGTGWINDPLEDARPAVDRAFDLGQRPLHPVPTTKRKHPSTLRYVVDDKAARAVERVGLKTAADSRSGGEFLRGEAGPEPLRLQCALGPGCPPWDKGSLKLGRHMLKLFDGAPIGWLPLRFVPFCTSSQPRLTELLRTSRRGVLVPELHSTARTVFVERSPAIEAPRRVVEAQAADPAAVYVATGH